MHWTAGLGSSISRCFQEQFGVLTGGDAFGKEDGRGGDDRLCGAESAQNHPMLKLFDYRQGSNFGLCQVTVE